MIKVIETNLSMNGTDDIMDHQSRVIEVEDWYDFINEIKECKTVTRNSVLGCMHGCTIPKQARIENLIYDDKHLLCDVYNYLGAKTKKLVYKI